jgi:hypothetical protein
LLITSGDLPSCISPNNWQMLFPILRTSFNYDIRSWFSAVGYLHSCVLLLLITPVFLHSGMTGNRFPGLFRSVPTAEDNRVGTRVETFGAIGLGSTAEMEGGRAAGSVGMSWQLVLDIEVYRVHESRTLCEVLQELVQ